MGKLIAAAGVVAWWIFIYGVYAVVFNGHATPLFWLSFLMLVWLSTHEAGLFRLGEKAERLAAQLADRLEETEARLAEVEEQCERAKAAARRAEGLEAFRAKTRELQQQTAGPAAEVVQ